MSHVRNPLNIYSTLRAIRMKTLARLYWKRLAAILVAQASPRDQENIQKILSTMRPERDFGKNVYLITLLSG
jgi:hypothetical protein